MTAGVAVKVSAASASSGGISPPPMRSIPSSLPTAAVEGLALAFALLTAILAAMVYRGLVLQADAREEL